MNERFFLYLDILGFTQLVKNSRERIDDLYEVIASLNVHQHDAFKVVVFSDTVIVYNIDGGDTSEDARYLIMFLCEFAKDLVHRLMGRNIYFRGVITHGDFTHYELNGIPCFFGNALVDAYNSEKEIKAIGLFMDKSISHYSDIFKLQEFSENYDFVYLTQSLNNIELWGADSFPIPRDLIELAGGEWEIYPEVSHVIAMHTGWKNKSYPQEVREKYRATWSMYCKRYPNMTAHLLANDLDLRTISPNVNWSQVIQRHPESHSDAIETKTEH
jgi:hypothetical protein